MAQREKRVSYGIEAVSEIPPGATRGGGRSELQDMLAQIKGDPGLHNTPLKIATYENISAAAASANVLRQRHGRTPEVDGWTFATRSEDQDGVKVTHLYVVYSPDTIVEGEKARHEAAEAERKARLEQMASERKAAEANGSDGDAGESAENETSGRKGRKASSAA